MATTTKKTIETTNDKKDKVSIIEIIQDIDSRLTHLEDMQMDNRELIVKLVNQGNTIVEFLKDFQIDEIDAEEMELLLPGKKFNRLHLYHGRNIHFYGRIRDHHEQGFRWKLELKQWGITPSNEVHNKIQRFRNRVGLLLMDRAAFYLPADVLSIYLPLSLAKRRSSSS